MRQLDLVPTGGRWGSIGGLRRIRLSGFSPATITAIYRDEKAHGDPQPQRPSIRRRFGGTPKSAQGRAVLWQSCVTLGEQFYLEVIDRPVPIDMRALRALKKSPMALDLYSWLTYRMSYLDYP